MSQAERSKWLLTFTDGSSEEIEADRVVRVQGVSGQIAVFEWQVTSDLRSHERLVCTLDGVARIERIGRPRRL